MVGSQRGHRHGDAKPPSRQATKSLRRRGKTEVRYRLPPSPPSPRSAVARPLERQHRRSNWPYRPQVSPRSRRSCAASWRSPFPATVHTTPTLLRACLSATRPRVVHHDESEPSGSHPPPIPRGGDHRSDNARRVGAFVCATGNGSCRPHPKSSHTCPCHVGTIRAADRLLRGRMRWRTTALPRGLSMKAVRIARCDAGRLLQLLPW